MNKKILILIILISLLFSFGCTQTKTENNNQQGNEATATIQEILLKGKNISNIEYDLEITTPFIATMKVYQKNEKYKTHASMFGQESEIIFDGKYLYNYDPEQDIYMQIEASSDLDAGGLDFKDFSEQVLSDIEMKELGEETVNEMKTRVIEFSYKDSEDTEATKTKAWISEEYGIPIKIQMSTSVGNAEMVLKNIKLNSVEDSVFVVPQQKIKTMEELLNEYMNDMNIDDITDLNYY